LIYRSPSSATRGDGFRDNVFWAATTPGQDELTARLKLRYRRWRPCSSPPAWIRQRLRRLRGGRRLHHVSDQPGEDSQQTDAAAPGYALSPNVRSCQHHRRGEPDIVYGFDATGATTGLVALRTLHPALTGSATP
jgi:hypothetical protein